MFGIPKKFKPLSDYPEDWAVAQGTNDGKPMVVRIQSSLKGAIGHPDYPHQIGVAVPLQNPTQDGLPTAEESKELDAIEDGLSAALTNAVLVAIITTNGMREFVFYTPEWKPEEFESQVKVVGSTHTKHQLQFMMQHDPNWSTFKSLLP